MNLYYADQELKFDGEESSEVRKSIIKVFFKNCRDGKIDDNDPNLGPIFKDLKKQFEEFSGNIEEEINQYYK